MEAHRLRNICMHATGRQRPMAKVAPINFKLLGGIQAAHCPNNKPKILCTYSPHTGHLVQSIMRAEPRLSSASDFSVMQEALHSWHCPLPVHSTGFLTTGIWARTLSKWLWWWLMVILISRFPAYARDYSVICSTPRMHLHPAMYSQTW